MKSRWHTITVASALTAILAVPLAGCGGDDDEASSTSAATTPASAGATLAIAADPGGKLAFDPAKLEAEAGTTTVEFENASGIPHAVEIEGNGIEEETETITEGTTSITVDLEPGTYEIYCPVGNHAAAGMKGELTVR